MLAADRDGRQMRHNLTGQYLQWKLQLCQWRQLLWDAEFQPPPALDDWCGEEDCLFWKVLVIQLLMLVLLSAGGGWVRVCAIIPQSCLADGRLLSQDALENFAHWCVRLISPLAGMNRVGESIEQS